LGARGAAWGMVDYEIVVSVLCSMSRVYRYREFLNLEINNPIVVRDINITLLGAGKGCPFSASKFIIVDIPKQFRSFLKHPTVGIFAGKG
jgi:hypothetical protein